MGDISNFIFFGGTNISAPKKRGWTERGPIIPQTFVCMRLVRAILLSTTHRFCIGKDGVAANEVTVCERSTSKHHARSIVP